MDTPNCATITFDGSIQQERVVVFFYTCLRADQLLVKTTIEIDPAQIAKSGVIPGLYVIEEFVTPEEEEKMIK